MKVLYLRNTDGKIPSNPNNIKYIVSGYSFFRTFFWPLKSEFAYLHILLIALIDLYIIYLPLANFPTA